MSITPIDVVIDPPLPTDAPSIFDQKAFAAWAAINGWAEQANALAVQVNTAADRVNDPSVQAVADNIADVMAVAGIEASVTIVATNSANVAAVAGNEANINAVNANKPNIDAVAGNKTNIDTVAGIAADVTAVASIDDDVSAVAGAAADVSTVATNISDVQAAAADMAAIKAAPGAADAAASSANTAGLAAVAAGDAAGDAIEARGQAVAAASAAGDSAGAASQSASDAYDILQQVIAHGNGWTPTIANVVDGERVVMQLLDWTGGQGTKPATGYIGPAGVVPTIGEATDIRGAPGSGAVSSVNSVEPDGNGNVDLGISDIPGLEDALDNAGQVKTVAGKGPDGSGDVSLGISDIPGLEDALDDKVDKSSLATVATTGSYDDLTDKPTLGTAATKNAPASGNAEEGEVVLGSDTRLTDSREWTASIVSQAEAEAGTSTTARKWTAQRVWQAITAWWNASAAKDKLDSIQAGATANQADAYLLDRANHTGTQPASSITGLTKDSVGLSNVDNTSDMDKPISTAVANALSEKADASALTNKANTNLDNVSQSTARTKVGTGTMAYRDVTISTSGPSGGANGDFWVQVES